MLTLWTCPGEGAGPGMQNTKEEHWRLDIVMYQRFVCSRPRTFYQGMRGMTAVLVTRLDERGVRSFRLFFEPLSFTLSHA